MNIQGVDIPFFFIVFFYVAISIPACIIGEIVAIKIAEWLDISA